MKRPHHSTLFSSSAGKHLALFAVVVAIFFLDGCQKYSSSRTGVTIVAAENYYGDLARGIAGDSATVISILTSPNQDPHEFTADARTATAISDADIVIYNGLGYDDWMTKLLAGGSSNRGRIVIRVADLIAAKPGDNPHICYDPRTMPALAAKLAAILNRPSNLTRFQSEIDSVDAKIGAIRSKFAGTSITATEPVFNDMASALGLQVQNSAFQLAVMNGTEPSVQATAEFEQGLRTHAVKLLLYNSQVTNPASDRMRKIAEESGIPVVGITETEPAGMNYMEWMLSELNAVESTLATK